MNKKAAEQQRAVRSMETPEQYSEFEDSVIEAAKTQAQRIIDDARRQGDANFDKLMEGHRGDPLIPYREEAKNRLARKMASVKQDNRKKLLVYRSQLVNGLFAEMEEALEEYTGTPAYAQRVADALARRAPEISGKCTVRLRRADEALLTLSTSWSGARLRNLFASISTKATSSPWTVPSVWAASSWKHSISCTTKRWISPPQPSAPPF